MQPYIFDPIYWNGAIMQLLNAHMRVDKPIMWLPSFCTDFDDGHGRAKGEDAYECGSFNTVFGHNPKSFILYPVRNEIVIYPARIGIVIENTFGLEKGTGLPVFMAMWIHSFIHEWLHFLNAYEKHMDYMKYLKSVGYHPFQDSIPTDIEKTFQAYSDAVRDYGSEEDEFHTEVSTLCMISFLFAEILPKFVKDIELISVLVQYFFEASKVPHKKYKDFGFDSKYIKKDMDNCIDFIGNHEEVKQEYKVLVGDPESSAVRNID